MKHFISIFFIIINTFSVFAQDAYHYNRTVKETVREGVLVFYENTNKAIYWDLLDTQKQKQAMKMPEGYGSFGGEVRILSSNKAKLAIYFKNDNQLSFTRDITGKNFFVTDNTLSIDWKLESETQKIDRFLCNKATANIRGRDWTVWYTSEIPVYYGPWKFYGLPGLVVKAEESTGQFAFNLTKIEKNTEQYKDISINMEDYETVTLKKFEELLEESWQNFAVSLNLRPLDDGKRNGIEKIYEWEEDKK